MCRIYTTNNVPTWVRCCCRTGHPGMRLQLGSRIKFTDAGHVSVGCLPGPGKTAAKSAPKVLQHKLRFRVPVDAENEAVIADMARYAHATAEVSEDGTCVTLIAARRFGNPEMLIRRAATFGWKHEPETA